MSLERQLKSALQQFKKPEVATFPATVIAVNAENGTCTVNDGDMDFPDVRLSAVVNGRKDVFYLIPKLKSSVLISAINEDIKNLFVVQYAELEQLHLNIGAMLFKVDEKGILLENNNNNFGKLQEDIITEITKVFTQNGLSFNPVKFEEFKLKNKSILNLNE